VPRWPFGVCSFLGERDGAGRNGRPTGRRRWAIRKERVDCNYLLVFRRRNVFLELFLLIIVVGIVVLALTIKPKDKS